jgi:IclR family KDG regulon transcriptional repressor
LLGTVCRAGDLLDLFDGAAPEWGATAVASELNITKSQAHEMLVSLEAIGLLRRSGRGRFRLGWKMVTLSERLLRSEFTADAARILRQLGGHMGTSVELVTFDGARCVRIGGYGPRSPRVGSGLLSASGRVLLAGMTSERLAQLKSLLGASPDLELELASVRALGFAVDEGDTRCSVAAPVHDQAGAVMAAVGMTVEPESWGARQEALTRAAVGTAARLSDSIRRRPTESFTMSEPALPNATGKASIAA